MSAGQVTSSPIVSQAVHVSNAMTDGEHDLLLVQSEINGRRATMLTDSGSTHDFISEDFVKRHSLATTSGPDDILITLADGSTASRQIVTTGDVKVVIKTPPYTNHCIYLTHCQKTLRTHTIVLFPNQCSPDKFCMLVLSSSSPLQSLTD